MWSTTTRSVGWWFAGVCDLVDRQLDRGERRGLLPLTSTWRSRQARKRSGRTAYPARRPWLRRVDVVPEGPADRVPLDRQPSADILQSVRPRGEVGATRRRSLVERTDEAAGASSGKRSSSAAGELGQVGLAGADLTWSIEGEREVGGAANPRLQLFSHGLELVVHAPASAAPSMG